MAIMLHWRLNTDGTIIITSFSAPLDHLCPKDDSVVRAELILGGYVFKRHPRGTEIKYVVQVNTYTFNILRSSAAKSYCI